MVGQCVDCNDTTKKLSLGIFPLLLQVVINEKPGSIFPCNQRASTDNNSTKYLIKINTKVSRLNNGLLCG